MRIMWLIDSVSRIQLVALASVVVLYLVHTFVKRFKQLPLPPGPKKKPIVGNLFDLPKEFEWIKYHEWAQEFKSDVIHIDACGESIIVVDTTEAAYELFEKRSSIYSSRPRFTMINELMGWDWIFAFMKYGDYWKHHRRLFQQEFHPSASTRFQPHEIKYTHQLLKRLLESPEDFMDHMRHATGAIIMDVGYAIEVKAKDDPYVYTAEKALYGLVEAAVPGTFLVDAIPLLKYVPEWFPGAGFQKKAKEWKYHVDRMLVEPFAVVQREMAAGVEKPSFVAHCLRNMDKTKDPEFQERIIRETAGNLYAAGSDTTVSALNSFILAMLCHPEVQAKAQKELDDLLCGVRLPDFDDEESLPYISAIVKEVIRWQPVTPIAIPHFLETEDEYNGYRIPANSTIVGNAWAMLHDERMYPDPFTFKPERWLKDGKLNPDVREPTAVFGFGRRICPGRHMAISHVWITAASVLASFNILKPVGEDGQTIEPSLKYHSALICHALPFECLIQPRSKGAEELILASNTQ